MKLLLLVRLSLLVFPLALVQAVPVPPKDNKTPKPPNPADVASTDRPRPPLPGRSGSYHDSDKQVVNMVYGDDRHPEHAGHVTDHFKQYPEHDRPLPLAGTQQHKANRKEALAEAPSGLVDPKTGLGLVRDEKPPAMLDYGGQGTTVKYVSAKESSREGALAKQAKQLAQEHSAPIHISAGPTVWDKNRDNDMRLGYSAPGALASGGLLPPNSSKQPDHDKQMAEVDKKTAAKASKPKLTAEKTEELKDTNVLQQHGLSNSASGSRNAWQPKTDTSSGPSHSDAPPPHQQLPPPPPRPQNQEAYDKMLKNEQEPHKDTASAQQESKRPLSLDSAGAAELRKTWSPPPQAQPPKPVPHTEPLPSHDQDVHMESPPASPVAGPSKPGPLKAKNPPNPLKRKTRKR